METELVPGIQESDAQHSDITGIFRNQVTLRMINISKYLAREFYLLKVKSILRDRYTLSLILYFLSSGASDHCVQES